MVYLYKNIHFPTGNTNDNLWYKGQLLAVQYTISKSKIKPQRSSQLDEQKPKYTISKSKIKPQLLFVFIENLANIPYPNQRSNHNPGLSAYPKILIYHIQIKDQTTTRVFELCTQIIIYHIQIKDQTTTGYYAPFLKNQIYHIQIKDQTTTEMGLLL